MTEHTQSDIERILRLGQICDLLEIDLRTFTGRKRIKNVIYLLKQFGFPGLEDYKFAWYVFGPFSPKLTKDVVFIDDVCKHTNSRKQGD